MAKTAFPKPRKGQGSVQLTQEEFARRLGERFRDPAFDQAGPAVERVIKIAWAAYDEYRKSPRTRKAGKGFANPDSHLPVEWLETRRQIRLAEKKQRDWKSRSRILVVCGAARHDQTCPGEMSKTFRLAAMARKEIERARGFECDLLDLSMLTAQYGRQILPCKACTIDRYIGYYEPYATSHDALDRDKALHQEVRNAARILMEAIRLKRAGKLPELGQRIADPRPK